MGCQTSKPVNEPVAILSNPTLLSSAGQVAPKSQAKAENPVRGSRTNMPMPLPHVAVCFQGGGLRAVSSYAGITAALLAALKSYRQLEPTLDSSGLYARFGQLSSVSGGSWFAASLVYSEHFAKMIEGMGANHKTAGHQFEKGWTDRWISKSNFNTQPDNIPDFSSSLPEAIANLTLGGRTFEEIVQTIEGMLCMLEEKNKRGGIYTWTNMVEDLMGSTADLPQDLVAGTEDVLPWSRDKMWVVNHVVAAPIESKTINVLGFKVLPIRTHICRSGDQAGLGTTYYTVDRSEEGQTSFLPAAFTVTLGAGQDSSAPAAYCEVESLQQLKYKREKMQLKFPCTCAFREISAVSRRKHSFDNLTTYAGKLPVNGILSASSAAGGSVNCLPDFAYNLSDRLTMQLMPFITNAANGLPFEEGNALLEAVYTHGATQGILKSFADAAVVGLADGGIVEDTGIAGAVARGAREIVAFMCNKPYQGEYKNLPRFTSLFPGDGRIDLSVTSTLFGEHVAPTFSWPLNDMVIRAYNGEHVNDEATAFKELHVPLRDQLHGLKVGTIRCTTADAKGFGIKHGDAVNLHVVSIESDTGVFFDEPDRYSALVQEVTDCIMDERNRELVSGTILPMFINSGL